MNLLIASVPSSGSDWFAGCVESASEHLYRREFFNPICNWTLADRLGLEFGCESPLYIKNILNYSNKDFLDKIINEIWTPSGYTMTKEIWSHRKLWHLKDHFKIVCLARRIEDSLPPTRSRVICWMHSIAKQFKIDGNGFIQDAIAGYKIWTEELENTAKNLDLPLIWWHDLINFSEKELSILFEKIKMPKVDYDRCANNIINTRITIEENTKHHQTEDAKNWECFLKCKISY